jgi:hypothetical protein
MLNDATYDKLKKSIAVCNRHKNYLTFALEQTADLFPVTPEKYNNLTQNQVSFLDQMIYRFSKLQDMIGHRVFQALLESLGEDIESMAFKDMLLRLEKLRILPSANEWMELREIRNLVSHEYPEDMDKLITGLNLLQLQAWRLMEIFSGLLNYLDGSFSSRF